MLVRAGAYGTPEAGTRTAHVPQCPYRQAVRRLRYVGAQEAGTRTPYSMAAALSALCHTARRQQLWVHAAEAAVELDGAAPARNGVAVIRRVQARQESWQPLRVQLLRKRCQLIPRGAARVAVREPVERVEHRVAHGRGCVRAHGGCAEVLLCCGDRRAPTGKCGRPGKL